MSQTGDLTNRKQYNTKASAIPFTTVDAEDLAVADNMLNQAHLSGKKAGHGFMTLDDSGRYALYVATGNGTTDTWQKVGGDATGTEDITPA